MAPDDRGRADAARERVLADHRETLAATLDAADAVATPEPPSDGATLRRRFRERLDDRGLLETYPAVLRTAADALGRDLAADPVPAPPYVVVTSTGPVLRGSSADGRLVVAVRAFALRDRDSSLESESDRRYVRTAGRPEDTTEIRTFEGF